MEDVAYFLKAKSVLPKEASSAREQHGNKT
jgi:hypothetical protein